MRVECLVGLDTFVIQNKDLYDLIIPTQNINKVRTNVSDTDDLVTNRARFTWRPGWLYAQSLLVLLMKQTILNNGMLMILKKAVYF